LIENETIAYLFKVKDGVSGSSFARLAALGVGFPRKIVDRADEVCLSGSTKEILNKKQGDQ
jgi:DNA mismatch repair ATPase MutS